MASKRKNTPQKRTNVSSDATRQKKKNTTNKKKTIFSKWILLLGQFAEQRSLLFLVLIWASIAFYVFHDFILLKSVYYFKDIGSDDINISYPALMMHFRMIADEGTKYFWSFYFGMGQAVYSGTMLDPLHFVLSPVTNYLRSIYGIDYYVSGKVFNLLVFNLLLIIIVSYGYFKLILNDRLSAILGALALTFSGYAIMGSTWGHTGAILRGIFLLFAFEQFYRRKNWFWLVYAFFLISENPFYMYLFSVFAILYSILVLVSDETPLKKALLFYAKASGLAILGILANAVNIITPYLLMFRSPRVAGDVSSMDSAGTAEVFQVDNFPEWITVIYRSFSTDLLGNGSYFKGWNNYLEAPAFYVGVFALVLLPQLFYFLKGRKRISWAIFVGFWMLTAFVPYLRHAIQLFVGNYYKGPYNVILSLIILTPAIISFSHIIKERKVQLYLLLTTSLLFLVLLNVRWAARLPFATNSEMKFWVNVLLVFYPALLWAITQKSFYLYAKIGFIALAILELATFSSYTVNKRKSFTRSEFRTTAGGYNDATMDAIAALKVADKTPFYRSEKEFASGASQHSSLNDAKAQGYFGTASYSSFNQEYYIKFLQSVGIIPPNNESATRWAMGVRGRPLLQTLCGVKYLFTKNPNSEMLKFGYTPFQQNKDVITLKNNYALPLGFCYDSVIVRSEFDKLSNFQKDVMLLRAAVIEDGTKIELPKKASADSLLTFNFEYYNQFVTARRSDTLQITSFKHYDIAGEIEVDNAKLLFLSVPFDYGWTMELDGTEVEIITTNIGFQGVLLPEGKHDVRIYYRPPYYNLALKVSYASIGVVLLMLFYSIWLRRKKQMNEQTAA